MPRKCPRTHVTQHQVLTQHHCTKNCRLELSTVTSPLGNLQPCSKKLRHFWFFEQNIAVPLPPCPVVTKLSLRMWFSTLWRGRQRKLTKCSIYFGRDCRSSFLPLSQIKLKCDTTLMKSKIHPLEGTLTWKC